MKLRFSALVDSDGDSRILRARTASRHRGDAVECAHSLTEIRIEIMNDVSHLLFERYGCIVEEIVEISLQRASVVQGFDEPLAFGQIVGERDLHRSIVGTPIETVVGVR